jgi:hypothetical protein
MGRSLNPFQTLLFGVPSLIKILCKENESENSRRERRNAGQQASTKISFKQREATSQAYKHARTHTKTQHNNRAYILGVTSSAAPSLHSHTDTQTLSLSLTQSLSPSLSFPPSLSLSLSLSLSCSYFFRSSISEPALKSGLVVSSSAKMQPTDLSRGSAS